MKRALGIICAFPQFISASVVFRAIEEKLWPDEKID